MTLRRTPFARCDKPSTTARLTIKPRKCKAKGCDGTYMPAGFKTWCGPDCGYSIAMAKREQAETKARQESRARDRKAREEMKSWRDLAQEAQVAFNAWVRARDRDLPCVSCLRHHQGQYHAGHYLSVGSRPEHRYTPTNVWKQCSPCNTHLSGNLVLYRAELIRRVGLAEVERLEGPATESKRTRDDLRAIRDEYRARVRQMER